MSGRDERDAARDGSGRDGAAVPDAERARDEADGDAPGARDAPLSDLAERARRRRGDDADEGEDAFDAFERMEGQDVDSGAVWERLAEGDAETVAAGERPAEDADTDRDVRVIPSSTCHGCRYFGAPPELHCTHEGTEIREMTEPERFTVVDCPMVIDVDDVGGLED